MTYVPSMASSQTLADQIQSLLANDANYADCQEMIAQAYGYASYDLMSKALTAGSTPIPDSRRAQVHEFWQSPTLAEFVADFACRRDAVVLALSPDDSVIAVESKGNIVFEIAPTHNGFTVFDLGAGPYTPEPTDVFRIPMDTFPTVDQAFSALAKLRGWDW